MMNKVLSSVKSSRLPLTSTSSTKIANTTMSAKLAIESARYGMALEIKTITGLKGDISNTSMVPSSFSLTIETDVSAVQTSMSIRAMTDRKSVGEGKSVSVSVALGGRRIIKKQK